MFCTPTKFSGTAEELPWFTDWTIFLDIGSPGRHLRMFPIIRASELRWSWLLWQRWLHISTARKRFGLCLLLKLDKFSKGVLMNPFLLRNHSCSHSNTKLPCGLGCATGALCARNKQRSKIGQMMTTTTRCPTTSWACTLCLSL